MKLKGWERKRGKRVMGNGEGKMREGEEIGEWREGHGMRDELL